MDDEKAVRDLFRREQPSLILHCAGVCDVDRCEASPAFAYRVNVEGARILAEHAPVGTRIVYCSSDHVFSGDTGPYDENASPDPITVYGRTRVAAERILMARPDTLVIRSGPWIGPSASGRTGHLDWLRYRHARRLPMTVVRDEVRSAVWADVAALRVLALARSGVTGIRHLTTTRSASRPELAAYLIQRLELDARIEIESRSDRQVPHLGRIELRTRHTDSLAAPLPAVILERDFTNARGSGR